MLAFRKPVLAIAVSALATVSLPAQAVASERSDAQCLMIFSAALGQYEKAEERDDATENGLYALVGYFSGKLSVSKGVDSLQSIMTEELAAEVMENYDSIQTRCVAESDQMSKAMIAAGKALSGE
ncbi:hypothetical protein I5L01_05715 [Erythrobacter sp. YJ-T3-07]|uniref:hypothetical protein n=1 Tax=Erythrobacter sp. YJ-T3-07 TaxID=2793063 RepID=UPI0018D3A7F8|nr:hypothetical protein [Erythrobacter sp. YJ-T3-07]MBH1943729.1 hypothetical protein [Erythrobacter sp. YJ-T3-07]